MVLKNVFHFLIIPPSPELNNKEWTRHSSGRQQRRAYRSIQSIQDGRQMKDQSRRDSIGPIHRFGESNEDRNDFSSLQFDLVTENKKECLISQSDEKIDKPLRIKLPLL